MGILCKRETAKEVLAQRNTGTWGLLGVEGNGQWCTEPESRAGVCCPSCCHGCQPANWKGRKLMTPSLSRLGDSSSPVQRRSAGVGGGGGGAMIK